MSTNLQWWSDDWERYVRSNVHSRRHDWVRWDSSLNDFWDTISHVCGETVKLAGEDFEGL